jgi:hypothetical protein
MVDTIKKAIALLRDAAQQAPTDPQEAKQSVSMAIAELTPLVTGASKGPDHGGGDESVT